MNLLILNGPPHSSVGRNPAYRGTYRAHPSYCDWRSPDDEINRLFCWFIEEGGESGVVHDLANALALAELWNQERSNHRFEVVEVVDGDGSPATDGARIGFDLSIGYGISLLQWGLTLLPRSVETQGPCHELSDLIKSFYGPQLNDQGLFGAADVASSCLRSMAALQDLCPAFYEGGNLREFHVVGIYPVDFASPRDPVERNTIAVDSLRRT